MNIFKNRLRTYSQEHRIEMIRDKLQQKITKTKAILLIVKILNHKQTKSISNRLVEREKLDAHKCRC